MSDGSVRSGGVVSRTRTVKVAVPTFPPTSVAVHVTVVEPSGKMLPDAGAHFTGNVVPSAAVAVALKLSGAPSGPLASAISGEAGTVTTGGAVKGIVAVASQVSVSLFTWGQVGWQLLAPLAHRMKISMGEGNALIVSLPSMAP